MAFSLFRPNCYALFYYARLSLYVLLEGSLTLYPIILQNRGILNASISSDEQLNMQINERLSHVESVANALQYDMYTLGQSDSTMEYLSALTDIRNDVSLFKSTFNLYYACIFLPSDRLGANERLYFFPLDEFKEYSVPETSLENPGTSSIWFYQKNVSVPLLISGTEESRNCIACCRILKDAETKEIAYAYIIFLDISEFSGYLEESFADQKSVQLYSDRPGDDHCAQCPGQSA